MFTPFHHRKAPEIPLITPSRGLFREKNRLRRSPGKTLKLPAAPSDGRQKRSHPALIRRRRRRPDGPVAIRG
jgi:hypothetical protein